MKKLLFVFGALFLLIDILPLSVQAQTKALWVSPRAGVWNVVAKDDENTNWTARLKIAKRSIRNRIVHYSGHFSWISDDKETSGREYFTGSFNRATGKLRLKAYAVKNYHGELAIGNYIASVNRKGRNIYRGTWTGNDNVPGKWSAVWLRFK